jgi:DNA invertase Pin-like site-specific DNA recombinase
MTDRLYLRISLDTAASGSISKQRAALRKAAEGKPVEYVDESISGSKVDFADRPAGRRLLADLKAGDRVLVTKIDRAARNVRDLLGLVERIGKAGAFIRFLGQDIDTSGPNGRFTLTLLGAVAEMEAAMIGERRKESLAAFKVEGRHAVGDAPYGLEAVPNPNGRGLVLRPHPVEAPALRDAVERLHAGASIMSLADDLGILNTRLSRVLKNDRLAGVLEQTPDGPRLDPDMAVFTFAEWDRLRRRFADSPARTWEPSSGIGAALSCAVCGERLYLNKAANPKHSVYKCRGVRGHGDDGKGRATVTVSNAEAHVESLFLAAMGHLPVTETVTVHSDAARTEAIALARLHMAGARKAQDAANGPEEEDAADHSYKAARAALRAAEALPISTFSTIRETGETFADAYARGGADRVAVLTIAGRWVVAPGRLPIAEKVRFMPDAEHYE